MNMFGSVKMRNAVVIMVLLFSFVTAQAQEYGRAAKNEVVVSEARVSRESRKLIIDYNVDWGYNVMSCDVELLMSIDGGRTFSVVAVSNKVQGDVGKITTTGQKQIVYDIDSIKEKLAGKQLAFKVQVKNKKKMIVSDSKGKFFVMGTASTFGMYGARAGYVKKFGGYVSYSDAFSGGMADNFSITAGGMMRAASWLYPYVGAGYGQLNFYGEENNFGRWHKRYVLLPIEIGAMFSFGPVALSAAVEPIVVFDNGVACSFKFGFGFCF